MERKEGRLVGQMLLWSGSLEKVSPKLAQGADRDAGGQCEQWKTPGPSLAGTGSGEGCNIYLMV